MKLTVTLEHLEHLEQTADGYCILDVCIREVYPHHLGVGVLRVTTERSNYGFFKQIYTIYDEKEGWFHFDEAGNTIALLYDLNKEKLRNLLPMEFEMIKGEPS